MLFSLEADDLSFLKIKKNFRLLVCTRKLHAKLCFPIHIRAKELNWEKMLFIKKRIPNGDITKPFRFRDDIYIESESAGYELAASLCGIMYRDLNY